MSHAERKRSRRRRPLRMIPVIGILIGLAAASGIGTLTLARYINGTGSGWLQISPDQFYFASDILEPGNSGSTIQLYNWNEEQDYVFFMDIKNWEDDFRVSPDDIRYSVTIQGDGASGIIGAVDGTTAADNTYTIAGGLAKTQKLVVTIPAGEKPSGNQVKVKIKAKPSDGIGYSKTLTGTFQLNEGEETCSVRVDAHNAYIDLLIGVDKGQTVTVAWPSCLTPDNTNQWLTGAGSSPGTVVLSEKSSGRLRFFVTGEIPSGAKFTVTEAGGASQTKPLKE